MPLPLARQQAHAETKHKISPGMMPHCAFMSFIGLIIWAFCICLHYFQKWIKMCLHKSICTYHYVKHMFWTRDHDMIGHHPDGAKYSHDMISCHPAPKGQYIITIIDNIHKQNQRFKIWSKWLELTHKKGTLSLKRNGGRHIYETNLSLAQCGQLTQVLFNLLAQFFAWSQHNSLNHLHKGEQI